MRAAWTRQIAQWARQFGQWLDPLPDEVSALFAVINQGRDEVLALQDELKDCERVRHVEVNELRDQCRLATDTLLTLQRQHASCIPVPTDELFAAAKRLTADWETRQAPSGEYKRHQVYAALIDAFPARTKREMALAIEAALWR